MKKIRLVLAVLTVALFSGSITVIAQMRYNLEVGQKYGLQQVAKQDITQNVQGMTQNIKNTLGGDMIITVKSKEGDVYVSDFVFESLLFKMESPMFSLSYDSKAENQEDNPMTQAFSYMVGHVFSLKFNERGEILEVRGFESLIDRLKNEKDGGKGAAGAIEQSLRGQFNDESMKQSLSSMLIVYPEGKLKKGITWDYETSSSGAMPTINKTSYTVESVSDGVVKIVGKGTIATAEGFTKEQNGMTQHFELSGNVTMNAEINAKTGWLVTMTQNQDMDGNVSIESPQLPTPMEMPMSIKSVIEYKGI